MPASRIGALVPVLSALLLFQLHAYAPGKAAGDAQVRGGGLGALGSWLPPGPMGAVAIWEVNQ